MQISAERTLKQLWQKRPDSELGLRTWYSLTGGTSWKTPAAVKATFGGMVDFVGDSRMIFNIVHNRCRLIVDMTCLFKPALIKFFGTHKEYDKINAKTG